MGRVRGVDCREALRGDISWSVGKFSSRPIACSQGTGGRQRIGSIGLHLDMVLVSRSAADVAATKASPARGSPTGNARKGTSALHQEHTAARNGQSRASMDTPLSRVEQVRRATGVGYVGLNVSEHDLEKTDPSDDRAIVWFDIDNTLYHKSTRIAELMGQRIHAYFIGLGLPEDEARQLHQQYYSQHGLAIRGLLKHHAGIDPLDYDRRVDGSLPLDDILKPEPALTALIEDLDRTKCRVFALTNAYKTHGLRCIRLLGLEHLFEGIIYCDYAAGPLFCCKPDKGYFVAAAELIGVADTSKFFFVDDSAKNIKAAKEMGWRSAVFYNEDEPQDQLESRSQGAIDEDSARVVNDSLAAVQRSGGFLNEPALKQAIRDMTQSMRIRLLNLVLDAASPSDLSAIRHRFASPHKETRDAISHLPDAICTRILEKLTIPELLLCRRVSKAWQAKTKTPALWRSHAMALTATDPEPIRPPQDESQWESLVQGLFFRERNWSLGIAQSIQFCRGHSGFVTAMKLRGRTTLVTGSYDGTIRVWDLQPADAPVCLRIIKADKISCLDFLSDKGVIAAGMYDTGRIMLFDLHTGAHLQTVSGHNKGIRNVALNAKYLVSVGQDKAICVWDYRSGERVVRFGQQSNVSLGVSLVNTENLLAVTIDGIIRSFSIPSKRLVGEFNISKIVRNDSKWSHLSKEFSADGAMFSWFAAHGDSITVASKTLITHLRWHESSAAPEVRKRRDSTESTASTATTGGTPTATPRRRVDSGASEASSRASSASRLQSRASLGASNAASSPVRSRLVSGSGPQPASPKDRAGATSKRHSMSSPLSPSSPSMMFPSTPSSRSMDGGARAKSGANLGVAPEIVTMLRTPEVATGAIHPQKRRVVCSSRFSSRAGAERALFTSTFAAADGDDRGAAPDKDARAAANGNQEAPSPSLLPDTFVPLSGAWDAHSAELSQPERNPMAIVLDHESIVVGCSDGLVYRIGFVGADYSPQSAPGSVDAKVGTSAPETEVIGHAVIKHLDELRSVDGWRDLFRVAK
ncbi:unnamed protein product [Parajaminaea phylloscopi]